MRYTSDGVPVSSFSMATNEKWNNSDGVLQERVVWWRVSAWRRLAETCNEFLHKGSQVLVEGRMNPDPETGNPRTFTRNNGEPGASYEVTALTVKFLGKKNGGNGYTPDDADAPAESESESIPF
jgi:single-strand DNA-binding protein